MHHADQPGAYNVPKKRDVHQYQSVEALKRWSVGLYRRLPVALPLHRYRWNKEVTDEEKHTSISRYCPHNVIDRLVNWTVVMFFLVACWRCFFLKHV